MEQVVEAQLVPVSERQVSRVVVQHNALAEARYRLSLRAQKLLIRLIAELDQKSEDFSEVTLYLPEFAALAAQERNDVTFAHFCDAAKQFAGRFVVITQPPVPGEAQSRQLICHWISSMEQNPNDKSIVFSFDKKLKPYLLGLKRTFFVYRTLYAFNLASTYGIRLYQWAKSREYLKRPQQISVDELRSSLGTIEFDARGKILKESLKRYADFKRVALKPALKEVNDKTDIFLAFKELKQPGTKIVQALVFTVRQKEAPAPEVRGLEFPAESQFELSFRENGDTDKPEEVVSYVKNAYQLNDEQVAKIESHLKSKGLEYVREKITLTELEPRENAARYLMAALRDDFRPPVRYVPPKKARARRPTQPQFEETAENDRVIAAGKLRELRKNLAGVVE
ncbi:MAG: replication initiation protein [Chthoniobacterales bacterium]